MYAPSAVELQEFVAAHAANLHAMNVEEFRAWLRERIQEAERQTLFRQRCLIRDLKREHRRRLRERERRLETARAAYEQTSTAREFATLAHEANGLVKAVDGLAAAVEAGKADRGKLDEFRTKLAENISRRHVLARDIPQRKRYDKALASWERLRQEIGLDTAEIELQELARQRGNSSVNSGERFEVVSSEATRKLIMPQVAAAEEAAVVLHGVTIGCARGEIDQVVVVEPIEGGPVEVRAVVEAKRNINDVVHGFRQRQENLAWFAGDTTGYDSSDYRTDRYREGHFDEVGLHQEGGRTWSFDRNSFARFVPKNVNGHRLAGLYFVTEQRPLLGTTTAELGRILYRVATDPGFNLDGTANFQKFRKWALELVERFQTRDVLCEYATDPDATGHVIFA